jgi:peptidoglycan biosynthesis protein MviN/MurJ (putative lipid II flippase)
MPARDPVVRALGGFATGAAAGGMLITIGLIALRTIQREGIVETRKTGLSVLSATVLLGIAAAAGAGWRLSHGIEETWRRALTATLAVFGALLLALVAAPADLIAGRAGLMVYLALLLAGGVWAFTHARRAA